MLQQLPTHHPPNHSATHPPTHPVSSGNGGNEPDVFLLTPRHSNVLIADFVAAWACGAADVLRQGSCRIFFKPEEMYDFLTVREEGCPTFACCAGDGCACLNPWAQQGGRLMHRRCGHGPDPAEPVKDGKGGCRLQGVAYAPGDLAWLMPKEARQAEERLREVDALLDLVRLLLSMGGCFGRVWGEQRS